MQLQVQAWHIRVQPKSGANKDLWFKRTSPELSFELVEETSLDEEGTRGLPYFLRSHAYTDDSSVEVWVRLVSIGSIQKYGSPSFRGQASSSGPVFFLDKPTRVFADIVKKTGGKCFAAFWNPLTGEVKKFAYDGREDECFEQPKDKEVIGVIGILPLPNNEEGGGAIAYERQV